MTPQKLQSRPLSARDRTGSANRPSFPTCPHRSPRPVAALDKRLFFSCSLAFHQSILQTFCQRASDGWRERGPSSLCLMPRAGEGPWPGRSQDSCRPQLLRGLAGTQAPLPALRPHPLGVQVVHGLGDGAQHVAGLAL